MYQLNSMAPFMSERIGDFDKMVPYYTPYSTSMYTYMPTKSNHLSNKQLGAYSYDPNEPRYSKLYKAYFRFFNYNLDHQSHLAQNHLPYVDLNNLARERTRNPQNFNYSQTFDNLPDSATLKTPFYDYFPHKADARRLRGVGRKARARKLKRKESIYYNNLFRAETAAALHHEIESEFGGRKISKKAKKKLLKKLSKRFSSKGNIIKFIDSEFPDDAKHQAQPGSPSARVTPASPEEATLRDRLKVVMGEPQAPAVIPLANALPVTAAPLGFNLF